MEAELPAIKVGGLKKNLPISPEQAERAQTWLIGRIYFDFQIEIW